MDRFPCQQIIVKAPILPFLQLHVENQQENTIPDTQALPVNCRCLSTSRLSCQDNEGNMLSKMRREGPEPVTSVIDGEMHVVISSYEQTCIDEAETTTINSFPMTSVLFPHDQSSKAYAAVPLTVEIIANAILWARGKKWKEDNESAGDDVINIIFQEITKSNELNDGFTELGFALSIYFKELDNQMPSTMC